MTEALRVLVVDDEAPARERLATLLDDIRADLPTFLVGSVADGLAALETLATTKADVVLTDIRMPKMGGIELAAHLQRHGDAPALVFTTAYDHHAVQAFELNAIDYLVKPIRAERLLAALRKATQAPRRTIDEWKGDRIEEIGAGRRKFFSCSERSKLLVIPVRDILYLRADAKYVTAKSAAREYLLDESLLKLEEEFSDIFLRVHRSVLVAKDAISGFERVVDAEGEHWEVRLRGCEDRLPVSRRQWSIVKRFSGA